MILTIILIVLIVVVFVQQNTIKKYKEERDGFAIDVLEKSESNPDSIVDIAYNKFIGTEEKQIKKNIKRLKKK